MPKDTSIIPKGDYCYINTDEKNQYGIPKAKYCPYMTEKEYNGIKVDYCSYLELGDVGNVTDDEHKKLLEYFGNEEKLEKELPLMLLFDGCKECGENKYTDKEMEEAYGDWEKEHGGTQES